MALTDRTAASPGQRPRAAPRSGGRLVGFDPARVSLAEGVVGGATLATAVAAWVALALADLGRFSLPAVAGAAAAMLLGGGLLIRRLVRWPGWALDGSGAALALVVGVLAGVLFFPGFPDGLGGRDPGVYVEQGMWIARSGSYAVHDELAAAVGSSPGLASVEPGERWPGLWVRDTQTHLVVPQFYALYPAALATGYAAGGVGGLVVVTPLAALLAVLAVALALRRVFGLVAGLAGGALLATNMMQVWQAKYPTSEAVGELLLAGALLGVVITVQTGWAGAAGVAGLLVGMTWLERPDGLLLIGLAVLAACGAYLLGRFDRRCWWFAAGLLVPLPHAAVQAYYLDPGYTALNDVPGLRMVAAGGVLLVAAVLAGRRLAHRRLDRLGELLGDDTVQRRVGLAVCSLAAIGLALGFLRHMLFGVNYQTLPGVPGSGGPAPRSYNEQVMRRLAWFFTGPGIVAVWCGLAVVALRRWRLAAWALVLPVVVLAPIYIHNPRVGPDLMWWVRRFVPIVVPGFVMLIAAAIGWAAMRSGRWRWPGRIAAAALGAFVLGMSLNESVPLHDQHTYAPSFALVSQIAEASGSSQGVYLVQGDWCCAGASVGGPLWLQRDELTALLPARPTNGYVAALSARLPGHPVFVLSTGPGLPAGLEPAGFKLVQRIRARIAVWPRTYTSLPEHGAQWTIDWSLWRFGPLAPADSGQFAAVEQTTAPGRVD